MNILVKYLMLLFALHLVQDLSKEHTDHVIVELTNGSVRLSLNTGINTTTATVGQQLNDGVWHQVTVALSGSQATISVDRDKCVGPQCTKKVVTERDSRSQHSGSPYLGGIPSLVPKIKQGLVSDGTFVGCIKVKQNAALYSLICGCLVLFYFLNKAKP